MLRDVRRMVVPGLEVVHDSLEVRSPVLRVGVHRGAHVVTDFALVERAAPFLHRFRRPCLSVVIEGHGRFEERDRRAWLGPGDAVISHSSFGGTEAYSGTPSCWMVLDWDPRVLGTNVSQPFAVLRLSERDRRRLAALAMRLADSEASPSIMVSIIDVLRAGGVPFERVRPEDLADEAADRDRRLAVAFSAQLADLGRRPAIEDLVDATGWNARFVHRRLSTMADRYALPWEHWRGALHHARLVAAFRLLAAPGATTETVARLTGFRSPTGLCHMLANAGLPSPGVLARSARRDVLEAWSAFARPLTRAASPA